MTKGYALLVDLEKCVGCYACEVGCQQWHNDSNEDKRVRIMTMGPDEIDGELEQVFIPIHAKNCDFCLSRSSDGKPSPMCVSNCPARARIFADEKQVLSLLKNSDKNHHVCKINQPGLTY